LALKSSIYELETLAATSPKQFGRTVEEKEFPDRPRQAAARERPACLNRQEKRVPAKGSGHIRAKMSVMTEKKKAALIYDFDGTLAVGNVQEHSFIPELGMTAIDFWTLSNGEAERHDADQILTYMREMLIQAKKRGIQVNRDGLMRHGRDVEFFEGVTEWFGRMNAYGASIGLDLHHYIVSSGIRAMIKGCAIAHEFTQIFASSFYLR
jgi:hypothetical protein